MQLGAVEEFEYLGSDEVLDKFARRNLRTWERILWRKVHRMKHDQLMKSGKAMEC